MTALRLAGRAVWGFAQWFLGLLLGMVIGFILLGLVQR